ncbi:hypothetical protein LY76DRAFT_125082 [Colletotrichum caudatum]|nr:hypothetical protein LY76DRAFT_125082 [Colletotrichum caudatum]
MCRPCVLTAGQTHTHTWYTQAPPTPEPGLPSKIPRSLCSQSYGKAGRKASLERRRFVTLTVAIRTTQMPNGRQLVSNATQRREKKVWLKWLRLTTDRQSSAAVVAQRCKPPRRFRLTHLVRVHVFFFHFFFSLSLVRSACDTSSIFYPFRG